MSGEIILNTMLWLPFVVAPLAYMAGNKNAKWVATATVAIETILAFVVWLMEFMDGSADLYSTESITWFKVDNLFEVTYQLGVDGLSAPLLLLSMVVFLVSVISSFYIHESEALYYFFYLLIITGVVGTFVALDLFLFFVFWEIVLVPMFFIIAIWGGERKFYASFKFFIFTHIASLFMLIGIFLTQGEGDGTFNMLSLRGQFADSPIEVAKMTTIFILLFIGFVVKFPQVPVHTWLPDAHVQAPSPGSAILAGLLLKMGSYGLMRVGIWLFMDSGFFNTLEGENLRIAMLTIGVVSLFYPALIALKQNDLKKMIAYSSISHMGTVLVGIAAFNEIGFVGAIFMMVAHGIISPGLFLLSGIIEHNTKNHTRDIDKVTGLAKKMPYTGASFVFLAFASAGLPLLAGFVAEVQAFVGIFTSDLYANYWYLAWIGVISLIITVSYYLSAVRRVIFGEASEELENTTPAKNYEIWPVLVLSFLTLLLGVVPRIIMDVMDAWASGIF